MSIDTMETKTNRFVESAGPAATGADTADAAGADTAAADYYRQYKAMSTAAVASATFGVVSLATFFDWTFLFASVLGIVLGLIALRQTRARPDELSGGVLAKTGIALSLLFAISGASYLGYRYATEVPEDARRISYDELQPDPDLPRQLFPPTVQSLDGQKVFIKGFIYPSKSKTIFRQFVLCRDKGDCCFGGNPKLTDRILVHLRGVPSIEYSQKLYAIAGTFHLRPAQVAEMGGGAIYQMDAELVR